MQNLALALPSSLKVLIAEDNEVNQLLAQGIFRHWGIHAMVAGTGVEVMECVKEQDFDVVLMDLQMPEKNGLEAAIEIRGLKDTSKRNIPIIALTANGIKSDEKKCMDAGINAFLAKPFNETQLYEVVYKVIENDKNLSNGKMAVVPLAKENLPDPMPQHRLYDMAQLKELAAGSNEFLISLAGIFLQTIPSNSTDMVAAAKAGNWDLTSKLAHKLKSTVDSMNMHSIKTDVRTIEFDAKNKKNIESLPALCDRVNNVIQQVAVQVKQDYQL